MGILLVAAFAAACSKGDSGGDDGGTVSCAPGASEVCLCGSGLSGVHTCNDVGDGWDACDCGSVDADGDTDGDTDADTDSASDSDGDSDTNYECSTGACCFAGFFRPGTYLCDTDSYAAEYGCAGTDDCGAVAAMRYQHKHCTGSSAICGVGNLVWDTEWQAIDYCSSYELCVHDTETAGCQYCDLGCVDGSCVDTDTGTDTDSGLTLHFHEYIDGYTYYVGHNVAIGPSTSTDPEDGSWTTLASSAAMKNASANAVWAQGYVVDLSAYSGQTRRLAFYYYGTNADVWYVDDVCIAETTSTSWPAACALEQTFDGVTPPALPSGWLSVAGGSNVSATSTWGTTVSKYSSSPNSAYINYDATNMVARYLVSNAIALP
ncbi:MAG: choice-of-anchor J domain-containing protein [Deltaproteobacteria bacterium]|nr:choice-of-anchor J domain-containing protein [Deltaproteobacteria bacterium]